MNINEKKEKQFAPSYQSYIAPEYVEDVARKIINKLMIEQKYRDPKHSAKHLSEDIGVGMCYISAIVSMRFQQNYSQLVANMRILEARYMLGCRNFDDMTVEDIATNVGFTTRQSFHVSFYKICGTTPKEYRMQHGFVPKASLPPAPKPKKKARKAAPKRKTKQTKKQ